MSRFIQLLPADVKEKIQERMKNTGTFYLYNTAEVGQNMTLPEADLTFQNENFIYQYVFVPFDTNLRPKTKIRPGSYSLVSSNAGLQLDPTELKPQNLLQSVLNTSYISSEIEMFFKKIKIYQELELPPARKILVHSQPGYGKTTAIFSYCIEELKRDPGTVVISWPTAAVRSYEVLDFFSNGVEYAPECTKMILVMEDIGGGQREGSYAPRGVDASLLEFLDGGRNVFKIPTFVAATTNNPENMAAALADRPGRFDKIIGLKAPGPEERVQIAEFIIKRELTEEEKQAIAHKQANNFSIAHIKEVVIRHLIHETPISQCVKELADHQKRFKENFEEKQGIGMGRDW